ncbi:unnamed protein product [Owenia fusiformis]|uniref:Uncharacterized protein n=1 Tax=Owenia fusiformis TaxID=6347 RepID=A0A8J1TWQ6_OWEFU|nr:unnamed protein product [Owenia fusiformis]
MICIILVAGHGTLLESEIRTDKDYVHLAGIPKALLPGVGGKRILDYWWETIKTRQIFSEVYLVTNADKYKHYERWATASDFPVANIVNDGTTTLANSIGAVADVDLVIRNKKVNDDIMVVAGDMLFQDQRFDVAQVVKYFKLKGDGDLAMLYEMEQSECTSTRGIVHLAEDNLRIGKFLEKPSSDQTSSRLASVVFYCFRKQSLAYFGDYLTQCNTPNERRFGKFMEWLINDKGKTVYGMKLPTGFQLIGQVGLLDYKRWLEYFSSKQYEFNHQPITKRSHARVGLMGNPSDGFNGKTISMSIANFWAEVTIVESERLVLMPHPLNDPTEFGSLWDLYGISRKEGYLGGLRLLQATCKKFYEYCSQKGIALGKRNFTLKYDTNIPRQVGLAGSSAIVAATLKCLLQFFNLNSSDMPKQIQPQFILDVEKEELFIQAGLQDRVIQVYEGLVYMDFSKELMDSRGCGNYEYLPSDSTPKFWLAYVGDPSDSGKIHSDVSIRWRNGDQEVVDAMKTFAQYTDAARSAIENKDWEQLASLMNDNFELRRKIYGDASLGAGNLRMIQIAREHGSAVKFPGSGGATVGLCLDQSKMDQLRQALQSEGFVVCDVIPYTADASASA